MFRASFNRHGGGAFCGTTQRLFSMGARSVNIFGKEVSKKSCNRARDSATTHGFIDPCFFLSSSINGCTILAASSSGIMTQAQAARATSLSAIEEVDMQFLSGLEAQLAGLRTSSTMWAPAGTCGIVIPLSRCSSSYLCEELIIRQT
jgi:hypothetical protein